jgi:putative spermidine/putrescine transport system ATP-binding protein
MGTPETIFQRPATPFVADFMGFENRFDGQVIEPTAGGSTMDADNNDHRQYTIHASGRTLTGIVNNRATIPPAPHQPIVAYFRPEAATLQSASSINSIPGTIALRTFRGSTIEYLVTTPLGDLAVHTTGEVHYAQDDAVHVVLKPETLLIMPKV